MLYDTGIQRYVNWEVNNVIQIKNKCRFRIILYYLDGTKKYSRSLVLIQRKNLMKQEIR